ncbi:hypothetical protein [Halococcus salsus]|uniref:hypothetical protein n=1 Tax=Halococcus salsus TaxID=2162894 RepID=UPI00135C1FF8|nr:hypothetical protein [Halococcus salsus]
MANTVLVAFGLLVDALGALSIAVPDLPLRQQRLMHKVSVPLWPYFRKRRTLDEIEGTDNLEEIKRILRAIWPSIRRSRNYNNHLYLGEFEEQDFWRPNDPSLPGTVSASNAIVVFKNQSEELYDHATISSLKDNITQHINAQYRVWGWRSLATGFCIQLIAQFL